MFLIPKEDPLSIHLTDLAQKVKIVVFIGLPGTGKSLLINQFYQLTKAQGREPQIIQWDVARKEFETEKNRNLFPTKSGQVHPVVRLSAGYWLLDYLKQWSQKNFEILQKVLLVEAPLVGNRFSELIHLQSDQELEQYLSSKKVQFVLPVPSLKVRDKIEDDRALQVSETAKTWSGAKPSVMRQLWLDTLNIAKTLDITTFQGEKYDPQVYAKTYQLLSHRRNLRILPIDRVYPINIENESTLHSLKNEIPSAAEVDLLIQKTTYKYPTDKDTIEAVQNWYKT